MTEKPNIPNFNLLLVAGIGVISIILINRISSFFNKSESQKQAEKIINSTEIGTAYDPKYYNEPKDKSVKKAILMQTKLLNGIIVGLYYSRHGSLFNKPAEFMKWLKKIRYKTQFSQVCEAYAKRYGKDLLKDIDGFSAQNILQINNYIESLPEGYIK